MKKMKEVKKEGIFKCPKCKGNAVCSLVKWQKNDNDKWIFYAQDLEGWIGRWDYHVEHNKYLERAVYDYPYDESDFTDVEEKVYIYYTTPEECWEKDGGQYLRDWNKYYDDKWICNWCKFESQKLSDFIPKN